MAYILFDPTFGNDAKPIDAATEIDSVRGNTVHLMGQSPASSGFSYISTDRPTTSETTYTGDSYLARWNHHWVRASITVGRPRHYDVHIRASVTSGDTAEIRVIAAGWSVAALGLPADPIVEPGVELTLAGYTSTTGEWMSGTLSFERFNLNNKDIGIGVEAGEPVGNYGTILMAVQGRITAGAPGTVTLHGVYWSEASP